jgi:spore coat protein U-like protein
MFNKNILIFLFCLFFSTYTFAIPCSLTSSGSINFTNYNPLGSSPNNGNTTLTVSCSSSTPAFTLTLSKGNSNNYAQRCLLLNGVCLNYNLYTSSAYNTIWGDGSSGTNFISGTKNCPSNNPCVYTVFGQVPAPQPLVPAGNNYSDSITATLTY